ncbi:MAG: hypothetical protein HWD58_16070 [Bacteroidota bacterium]|nr:MAG: hypothetical protein HWD58_16070 [Bacteroidota bacterium]
MIGEHPVSGVGYGDVFEEMRRKFDRDFGVGKIYPLIPHNQFLMSSVALGLPGGILILLILFYYGDKSANRILYLPAL